jgi:hypothetical protein
MAWQQGGAAEVQAGGGASGGSMLAGGQQAPVGTKLARVQQGLVCRGLLLALLLLLLSCVYTRLRSLVADLQPTCV